MKHENESANYKTTNLKKIIKKLIPNYNWKECIKIFINIIIKNMRVSKACRILIW